MDPFIPGLVQKYGANKPINLQYHVASFSNFHAKEADPTASFNSDIDLKFWVQEGNSTADELDIFDMEPEIK